MVADNGIGTIENETLAEAHLSTITGIKLCTAAQTVRNTQCSKNGTDRYFVIIYF